MIICMDQHGATWCMLIYLQKDGRWEKIKMNLFIVAHVETVTPNYWFWSIQFIFSIFEGQWSFAIALIKLYGVDHGQTHVQHNFSQDESCYAQCKFHLNRLWWWIDNPKQLKLVVHACVCCGQLEKGFDSARSNEA